MHRTGAVVAAVAVAAFVLAGCASVPGPAERVREEFRGGNLPGAYRMIRAEGEGIEPGERAVLLLDLGMAFDDRRDRIRAEWCYAEAARAGRRAEGLIGIAGISLRREEHEEAVAKLREVLALPDCPSYIAAEARLHLGASLVSLGRTEEGLREWEAVIRAENPDADPAVSALADEATRRLRTRAPGRAIGKAP